MGLALLGVYLDPLPMRGRSATPQSAAVSGLGARPPGTWPSPYVSACHMSR